MTINSISYAVNASFGYPSWYAFYSIDDFATYTALGSRNSTSHAGLAIDVPDGSVLTLRIYGMDVFSSAISFRNKNVIISGTTALSCTPQTVNNPQTICIGESYLINGNTYTTAGTYTDVFQSQSGCDSTVTTILTVLQPTINNAISYIQNGTALFASEGNANYQWINCNSNNAPIAGAISQSFVPLVTGNYGVILTSTACQNVTSTSSCLLINPDSLGLSGDLFVAGNATFNGDLIFKNRFIYDNLETSDTTNNSLLENKFLSFNKDGESEIIPKSQLRKDMYLIDCYSTIDNSVVAKSVITYITLPSWASSIANNKSVLYTGTNCPTSVGIGTHDPLTRLDVRGNARFTDAIGIGLTTIPQASLHIKNPGGSSSQKKDILLLIENSERKLLQLNDNGLLQAREIKVDLGAWPDYVFKKDYDLMPLKDLGLFIKINGHLPNIPKAETIEKDGLSLGEMNKLLMEKVEELTLYLLQQDQKQDAQEKRIAELEALVKTKKQ